MMGRRKLTYRAHRVRPIDPPPRAQHAAEQARDGRDGRDIGKQAGVLGLFVAVQALIGAAFRRK